ncbi:MAG: spheroidene monooxygenase [Neomegalonema sp.]
MGLVCKAVRKEEATIQTVSLSFFRFRSIAARLWAFSQMGFAHSGLKTTPGVGFYKLCGTGTGEGFTPAPNTGVYTILATWPSLEHARDQVRNARSFKAFRDQSSENWTLFMAPTSARGKWAGVEPFKAPPRSSPPQTGPIAALTRARLKPSIMRQFWRRVPDISTAIGADPNVAFKIGMGEAPLINQVTFSIWPNAASMAAFARADGPHARAIKAVRDGAWFAEELYARFEILADEGAWTDPRWQGDRPLARFNLTEAAA